VIYIVLKSQKRIGAKRESGTTFTHYLQEVKVVSYSVLVVRPSACKLQL